MEAPGELQLTEPPAKMAASCTHRCSFDTRWDRPDPAVEWAESRMPELKTALQGIAGKVMGINGLRDQGEQIMRMRKRLEQLTSGMLARHEELDNELYRPDMSGPMQPWEDGALKLRISKIAKELNDKVAARDAVVVRLQAAVEKFLADVQQTIHVVRQRMSCAVAGFLRGFRHDPAVVHNKGRRRDILLSLVAELQNKSESAVANKLREHIACTITMQPS